MHDVRDSFYDVAEVCPNGHVANHSTQTYPQHNRTFCEKCGEKTITKCPACHEPIRGDYHVSGYVGPSGYEPPAFCSDCGRPFPWTDRRLAAAKELVLEAEHLTADERIQLAETLDDIVRDVPRTQIAAMRFKRLATKAGAATAGALRDIIVDVASETAKKIIWPA